MSFISKSIVDGLFLLNKSFTYFWVTYHMVKLQIYSFLHSTLIATKMGKCLLSLKVLQIGNVFKISHSPTFVCDLPHSEVAEL